MAGNKNVWKKYLGNIIFFGLLLIFLISTPAKSWLLRQFLRTGLFSPKIENKQTDSSRVLAMPLTFKDENGIFHSTENMRGKVVFINFWASWCPPCIAEMPGVNEMYQQLRNDSSIAFVFINLDDTSEKGKEFLNKKHFDIPLQRADSFIPTDLYEGSLPTTVILDRQGRIVMKHTGLGNYNTARFKKELTRL